MSVAKKQFLSQVGKKQKSPSRYLPMHVYDVHGGMKLFLFAFRLHISLQINIKSVPSRKESDQAADRERRKEKLAVS